MSFQIQISILFASNILNTKGWAMREVIYECIRGLDGRIPDCKLTMHANYLNKKAWFMILGAGIMVRTINWIGSNTVAITALDICVFTHMVHGGRRKCIATKKTLVTIQMGVSFVWSPFLLNVCHQ